MKTKLENLKGKWVGYLPEVLWAYRTTHKSATQETPFALAFGTELVAPVEVGLKSLRIELEAVEHNDEALHLNLDLLDEKRDQVKAYRRLSKEDGEVLQPKSQTQELYARRLSLKEAPASKEESSTWKIGPQLGRPLHRIPGRQARQL